MTSNQNITVFHSRGSIEQSLCEHMSGPSHHLHHDCKQLRWKPTAPAAFRQMFAVLFERMVPGGIVLIAANGSADDEFYDREIKAAAEANGFELIYNPSKTIHKWRKSAC